ncbi:MAG: ABC transporter substrate-binding protein [Thermoleophilaceae bacterium]
MRRGALLTLAAAAALAAGCTTDGNGSSRASGDTLTVYSSLPAHGLAAASGKATEIGMRRAVADAGGRAGGRAIRLVVLPSTRPGDRVWDPGTIEANAQRAAADRSSIAYIGELDQGASAVSLPVTNAAGLLQISPADGLTSLTRTPPGRPRAGPERYYPSDVHTFARLVPPDLVAARWILSKLRERRVARLAILHGDRIADRELDGMLLALVGAGPPTQISHLAIRGDDEERLAALVEETASLAPDAVVISDGGPGGRLVAPRLADRLPGVPVIVGPPLIRAGAVTGLAGDGCALTAVPGPDALPARGRRLLRELSREHGRPVGGEAALGYDAMRLALAAIDVGGPDRRLVVRAARSTRARDGATGSYAIGRRGSVEGRGVECVG